MPDVSIALDVTLTGDVPESRPMDVRLGAGPAIKVGDSGMIAHAGLVRLMRRRAEEAGIDYQLEVLEGGTTDARPMHWPGRAVSPAASLFPPLRPHAQRNGGRERCRRAVALLVTLLSADMEL